MTHLGCQPVIARDARRGSEDRGDQSYQSYATASAAKSSNGPNHDHRAFTTEEG
jgi:hypothetical protein